MNFETITNLISSWNWIPSGFRYPIVLWLEILPLALLIWIWLRESRAVALPVDHSHLGSGRWSNWAIRLVESLTPLLVSVLIVLMAGPLQLGKPQAQRKLTNIMFCVDVSGSMMAEFGEGNRYDASMAAINSFLDARSGDAFGLTFFGNSVLHWTPLTSDASAIRCSVPFMRPENVPIWMGGTEIGKALLACRKLLMERETGDRMIILVSDGASSDLSGNAAQEVTDRLVAEGIVVYAIHIDQGDAPDEIVRITTGTGGDVFVPGDPEGLQAIFSQIDEMQRAEIERVIAEQLDNFAPYSAVSILLVLIMVLASYGLRFTPW
jgi:Ca-activated chloride channel family protein